MKHFFDLSCHQRPRFLVLALLYLVFGVRCCFPVKEVTLDKGESGVTHQMPDIVKATRAKVVINDNLARHVSQCSNQVTTYEASAPRDEDGLPANMHGTDRNQMNESTL